MRNDKKNLIWNTCKMTLWAISTAIKNLHTCIDKVVRMYYKMAFPKQCKRDIIGEKNQKCSKRRGNWNAKFLDDLKFSIKLN